MLSHCLDGLCPILYSFNLFDSLYWSGFKFYSFKILFFLVYSDNLSHPVKQGSCYARKLHLQMLRMGQEWDEKRLSLSLSLSPWMCSSLYLLGMWSEANARRSPSTFQLVKLDASPTLSMHLQEIRIEHTKVGENLYFAFTPF